MADDRIETEIVATTGEFQKGMSEAAAKVKEAVESIKGAFESLAELAGISLAVEGIKHFIESMGELGLQTEKTMAQLGLSAEQVGVFSGVAKLSGASLETFTTGIERMSLNIQRSTRDAFNPAAQGLHNLGISAKEFIALDAAGRFDALAEAVSRFNPSLNLTNNLMAIGGRGIAGLLPMLLEGKEHFEELKREVEETGSTLNDVQTKGFAQTHEKITLLGLAMEGFGIKIFTIVKPAIDAAADGIRKLIENIDPGSAQSAINAIGNTLLTFAEKVSEFFAQALALAEEVSVRVRYLSTFGLKAFTSENTAAMHDEIAKLGDASAAAVAAITKKFAEWRAVFNAAVPPVGQGEQFGPFQPPPAKRDAPGLNLGGKDALAAQKEALQAQIKLVDEHYKQIEEQVLADAKLGKITEGQKTATLLEAIDARKELQLGYYDQESKLAGLSAAERQKIEEQKTQIVEKATLERQKIINQALLTEQKEWIAVADQISGAFNSQLRGVLSGTTSWAQAMKNVMGDLIINWISILDKMALEWVAKQLFMVAVHATGEEAMTTASATGVAARLAAMATEALGSIAASVGQIFASLTAFLAPVFGPAAPAAALGIAGGVGATAIGLVGKYEMGTDYVPRTGLALVHQGEKIIPASQNKGGGGQTFNLTYNAARGGANPKAEALAMARALQTIYRDNPSLA